MTGKIDDISHKLGSMDGKLDGILHILASQKERLDGHSKRIEKLDSRMDTVEKRYSWFLGAIAAIGAVFSAAFTIIKADLF